MPKSGAVTFFAAAIIALGVGAGPVFAQDDKKEDKPALEEKPAKEVEAEAKPAAPPKCTADDIKLMQSKAAPMAEGDAKSKALSELKRAEAALAAKDMQACNAAMAGAAKAMEPPK